MADDTVTAADLANSKDIGDLAQRVVAIENNVCSIKTDVSELVEMMRTAQAHDDIMCTVATTGRFGIRVLTWVLSVTIPVCGLILTWMIATGRLAPSLGG